MGLWDALRGRTRPAAPRQEGLFALPSAALTLQAAGWAPTGAGAICYRAAEGRAFAETQADLRALLDSDEGVPVRIESDGFGFTWIVASYDPPDTSALVTDLHAVVLGLAEQGFGGALLCAYVGFRDHEGVPLAVVYTSKTGRFHPFVPRGGRERDNLRELQVRDTMAGELPVEGDLARWLAIWDAPGL